MKIKFLAIVVISVLLIFVGCKGQEENADNINDDNTSVVKYMPSGMVEDGPCISGGAVTIRTLYSDDLTQTGEEFVTTIKSDWGFYDASEVMKATSYRYAEIEVEGSCYAETTGIVMPGKKTLKILVDLSVQGPANVNPPTTIITSRIRQLYNDASSSAYQNFAASEIQADKELKENVFGIYGLNTLFREMSLNDTNGGPLLAINSMLLWKKEYSITSQEQMLQDLSNALPNADQKRLGEIQVASKEINLFKIKRNVEAIYSELDVTMDAPDFWNYIDSDNDGTLDGQDQSSDNRLMIDIIEGNLKITYDLNLESNYISISQNDHVNGKDIALPYVFDSDITPKYMIYNIGGPALSIHDSTHDYTVSGIHNGIDCTADIPGTLLHQVDKIEMNAILSGFEYYAEPFDAQGNQYKKLFTNFVGDLDNQFTFQAGKKYWFQISHDAYSVSYMSTTQDCQSTTTLPHGNLIMTDGVNPWNFAYRTNCVSFYFMDY